MVGNTLVVFKARIKILAEKSTCGCEFVACQNVIEEVLGIRELVRFLGYKVDKPSRIFCDNKGVVVTACSINMMIKKRSIALAFHCVKEAIASGTVEI